MFFVMSCRQLEFDCGWWADSGLVVDWSNVVLWMVTRKCWHGKEWIVLTWKRRVDTGGGGFFSWVDCFWCLRRRVDTRGWCVKESGRVKSRGRVNLGGFVKPVWFCLFGVCLSVLCGFDYHLRGLTCVVVVLSLWRFLWVRVIRRESRLWV